MLFALQYIHARLIPVCLLTFEVYTTLEIMLP